MAARPPAGPTVSVLATGLRVGAGSTIGPDGALYVTEWEVGRVSHIDPETGAVTTFADGLPPGLPWAPYSGAVDVGFHGCTAYVLVTLVGPDVGGDDVVGLDRVGGPDTLTVAADLGAWSEANPPDTAFEVPTGATYAPGAVPRRVPGDRRPPQPGAPGVARGRGHRGGRVRQRRPDRGCGPGDTVYAAETGPVPHLPADGRVTAFDRRRPPAVVAAGAPLLVDVGSGRGNTLYALSHGERDGVFPGDPAEMAAAAV